MLALAESLGAREPGSLADGLLLLIEGTYAISQTLGGRDSPGHAVVSAAEALVEGYLARPRRRANSVTPR